MGVNPLILILLCSLKFQNSDSVGLNLVAQALPEAQNLANYEGIDANGGSLTDTRVGVIEGGKVKQVKLSELAK
jgi:hypothetical protein